MKNSIEQYRRPAGNRLTMSVLLLTCCSAAKPPPSHRPHNHGHHKKLGKLSKKHFLIADDDAMLRTPSKFHVFFLTLNTHRLAQTVAGWQAACEDRQNF